MRLNFRRLAMVAALLAAVACGDDDDDDDSDSEKCDQLVDVATECFDGYCQGAGMAAPFCGCWNNGQDINTNTCECVPLNLEQACSAVNLDEFDPNLYDCATARSLVSDICN